jgi:hypothetical protein
MPQGKHQIRTERIGDVSQVLSLARLLARQAAAECTTATVSSSSPHPPNEEVIDGPTDN